MKKKINENEIHLWVIENKSLPFEKLSSILSEDEILKYNRFHFKKDQELFASSHYAMRMILSNYLSILPNIINYSFEEKGKPYLINSPIAFNLSHSHNLAVLAVSTYGLLGADVEYIHRKKINYIELANRFFSKKEADILNTAPDSLVSKIFFNCWTRKEAFIKATGDGLSFPLDQFQVSMLIDEKPKLLATHFNENEYKNWSLHAFKPAPNYVGAVAIRKPESKLSIFYFDKEFSL